MKRLIVLIIFMFALYPLAAGAQPNIPEYDTEPEEDVQIDKEPEIYQKPDSRDERQREEYMDRDMDRRDMDRGMDRDMDRDHRTYDRDEVPRERDGYREPGEYRENRQRDRIRDPEMHE